MKKLPENIKAKIRSYAKHSSKANRIRREIDSWFESKGMSLEDDFAESDGRAINDILIDTGNYGGSAEQAIELIERQLI